jgi:hypothetical protein
MTKGLERYVELLDELLWRRAVGNPDDETEAYFAVALNDCRSEMTPDEEARIEGIVAQRIAVSSRPSLGLVDTNPPATDDSPLRTAA